MRIIAYIIKNWILLTVLLAGAIAAFVFWPKDKESVSTVPTVETPVPPAPPVTPQPDQATLDRLAELERAIAERDGLISEQRRIAQEAADKVATEKAEAEAKAIADKAAADARELAEMKELEAERGRAIDRLKSETIDYSKNWVPHGQIPVADKDVFNRMWKEGGGWIEFKGRHFPLLANNHGNPAPIKGDNPPDFIVGCTGWEMREITLKNPKGSGSYTTMAWSSTTKPTVKK